MPNRAASPDRAGGPPPNAGLPAPPRGPAESSVTANVAGPDELPELLSSRLAGRFIVLEGGDGAGKSTQLALLADRLAAAGLVNAAG
ncbi:MAG: hypothetical protein LBH68_02950, partial [Bifidobacteriaceae bacterium]|nr:hypothetical protein [Bifidobacteriaceae bacterium]